LVTDDDYFRRRRIAFKNQDSSGAGTRGDEIESSCSDLISAASAQPAFNCDLRAGGVAFVGDGYRQVVAARLVADRAAVYAEPRGIARRVQP